MSVSQIQILEEYPVEVLIDPVDGLKDIYHTALLINNRVISYGRAGCQIVSEDDYISEERVFLGMTSKKPKDVEQHAMNLNENEFKNYEFLESNCNMFTNRVMYYALGWTFPHGLNRPTNLQETLSMAKYHLFEGYDPKKLIKESNEYYRKTNQLKWVRDEKFSKFEFWVIFSVGTLATLIFLNTFGPYNSFSVLIAIINAIEEKTISFFEKVISETKASTITLEEIYNKFMWKPSHIRGYILLINLIVFRGTFSKVLCYYVCTVSLMFLLCYEKYDSFESYVNEDTCIYLLLFLYFVSYCFKKFFTFYHSIVD